MAGGALAGLGIAKRSWAGVGLAAAGGALLWRGLTRHCAVKNLVRSADPVRLERSFTVPDKSPEEVYEFWRNFENLPRAIPGLRSVSSTGDGRWRWVAKGPAGMPLSWDAEITNEHGGRLIEWRSTRGSILKISGIVRFKAKHGRGTKVHISIQYVPPGGALGEALANLLRQHPDEKLDSGLHDLQHALTES